MIKDKAVAGKVRGGISKEAFWTSGFGESWSTGLDGSAGAVFLDFFRHIAEDSAVTFYGCGLSVDIGRIFFFGKVCDVVIAEVASVPTTAAVAIVIYVYGFVVGE